MILFGKKVKFRGKWLSSTTVIVRKLIKNKGEMVMNKCSKNIYNIKYMLGIDYNKYIIECFVDEKNINLKEVNYIL